MAASISVHNCTICLSCKYGDDQNRGSGRHAKKRIKVLAPAHFLPQKNEQQKYQILLSLTLFDVKTPFLALVSEIPLPPISSPVPRLGDPSNF